MARMTTLRQLDRELSGKIIDAIPREIEPLVDGWHDRARQATADTLGALLQNVAWRMAYVETRYGSGCGDQGHRKAVKAANRMLTRVRKAMGYAYPERALIEV